MTRLHTTEDERCRSVRTGLSARYDGEPAPGAALDEHVATCTECAAFERDLTALSKHLAGLRAIAPPVELAARIAKTALSEPGRRTGAWRRRLLQAAAAVVGFLAIQLIARGRTASAPPSALDLFASAGRSQAAGQVHTPPEQALLLQLLSGTKESR